jgi:hypothetical protein
MYGAGRRLARFLFAPVQPTVGTPEAVARVTSQFDEHAVLMRSQRFPCFAPKSSRAIEAFRHGSPSEAD